VVLVEDADVDGNDYAMVVALHEGPPGWTCDPAYYNSSDGCDCECGAYDPDCDDPSAQVWGCEEGQTCDSAGHCTGGPSDCGNGGVDVGEACDGDNLDGESCTNLGFTGGTLACASDCLSFDTSACTGSNVPPEWTCEPAYYNATDGCDCECGAYDPDCAIPDAEIYGCGEGQTCDSTGHCTGSSADCGNGAIDAGEACDGNDLNDEDCLSLGFTGGTLTCVGDCLSFDTSACTGTTVPPDWTCEFSHYADSRYCDCDCGAHDPDCDDPDAPIYNCYPGQTCDANGNCIG
jgi:hypothetical protein